MKSDYLWITGFSKISGINNFTEEFLAKLVIFCKLQYEGRSKSFAIQYDAQTIQAKQLHYFSI